MFEIGFWELCLVAVVALVVIGPERLPKVAHEAGKWVGKVQRFVRNARFELERELHNYEIQQTLIEQKKELEEIARSAESAVEEIKQEINAGAGKPTEAKSRAITDAGSDKK